MIPPIGEVGDGKRCAGGKKLIDGIAPRGNADRFETRLLSCLYIQRCIPYDKNVRRRNWSAVFVGCFFSRLPNELGSILRIGTEAAKFKVAIEIARLELNPGAKLDVPRSEAEQDVPPPQHIFE